MLAILFCLSGAPKFGRIRFGGIGAACVHHAIIFEGENARQRLSARSGNRTWTPASCLQLEKMN